MGDAHLSCRHGVLSDHWETYTCRGQVDDQVGKVVVVSMIQARNVDVHKEIGI